MSNIVSFNQYSKEELRKKLKFINRNTSVKGRDGKNRTFPCIVLVDKDNDIPIAYTGYEKYICSLNDSDYKKGNTLSKKAFAVCCLLNYMLKEAHIDKVSDITINDIADYLEYSKKKNENEERKKNTFIIYGDYVIDFLVNYYNAHKFKYKFNYEGDKLKSLKSVRDKQNDRKYIIEERHKFFIESPKETPPKNRYLVYGYLDLLLYEAKKYDPMIELGIGLESFAGLREGEAMNVTCGRVGKPGGPFSSSLDMKIDITSKAPFWDEYKGKVLPAEFKESERYTQARTQQVYYDFVNRIKKMYDEHIGMLHSKGYSTGENDPLFVNSNGNPMTTQTYSKRVKKLFYERFLPSLKRICIEQNTLEENIAYIEAYEENYPGAHMFRHWFTMYLLTKARTSNGHKLSDGEIMAWRNDHDPRSMISYIHINSEFIDIYEKSAFRFQRKILEDIERYDNE